MSATQTITLLFSTATSKLTCELFFEAVHDRVLHIYKTADSNAENKISRNYKCFLKRWICNIVMSAERI